MTLKPLLPDQFECIRSLLVEGLKESHMEKFADVDHIFKKLNELYLIRSAGVYVDSSTDPKHCLIMTHFPSLFDNTIVAHIARIFTRKEFRGNKEAINTLMLTAENYARLNGASSLCASSWIFRGSKATDALWKKEGFEIQSHAYTKYLK